MKILSAIISDIFDGSPAVSDRFWSKSLKPLVSERNMQIVIDDIIRLAKEYKVDGVIDVNLKFCSLYDVEGYTVERELKKAGIPVLGIETDYVDSDAQQLRTRISAFIEMLGA